MTYDEIQRAAFVPDPAAGLFLETYHTLSFPTTWQEPLLRLYQHGKSRPVERVPIRRLNATLRAGAPDLVSVASYAPLDGSRPWLYAEERYPPAVMNAFIHAWLQNLQPKSEAYPLLRETVRELDVASLEWEVVGVDMLEQTASDGGTALPAPHLYRLLPDLLAARIAAQSPYRHCGEELRFFRVAGMAGDDAAELISWPPLEHTDSDSRVWPYSAYLHVSLRTVPFSLVPRVHLSVGIRRWVTGRVWMPQRRRVSVFLRTDGSLVAGAPTPARFAVAQLEWSRKTREIGWAHGGPEGMLARVGAVGSLPLAGVLAKEPETWLPGRDGVTAAVVHHTMMGNHEVKAGLMPSERRGLIEWAAAALEPQFRPIGPLRRTGSPRRKPPMVMEARKPVGKDPSEEKLAGIKAANTEIDVRNATKRRSLVAAAVGADGLDALVLWQTDAVRDRLVAAAEESLGLWEHRVQSGPGVWSWETPELAVRLEMRQLGPLGTPLGDGEAPRRGEDWEDAIRGRRAEVRTYLADYAGPARLVFVELAGKEKFRKRTTDPKAAIRLGAVDAGLVSQFIKPRKPGVREDRDDLPHRARAAFGDGIRQLGARIVPGHSAAESIPDDLSQIAFWLVRRQVGENCPNRQFTPIALLIRPRQDTIMGRLPDSPEWVPYPQLLRSLVGQVRDDELKSEERQKATTAAFVRRVLYQLRGEPTLVVTHAQNARRCWDWLKNAGLVRDRVRIGGGPAQRLDLYGRGLRIARVADNDRDEAPQWWAPTRDGGGHSKGLWTCSDADANGRVYYSTADKTGTQRIAMDTHKLTSHVRADATVRRSRPGVYAANPALLELAMAGLQDGDDPTAWATYLHQQRFAEDYADGLALPLILHLARLTSEYALPHEDVEEEVPDDDPSDPADDEQLDADGEGPER